MKDGTKIILAITIVAMMVWGLNKPSDEQSESKFRTEKQALELANIQNQERDAKQAQARAELASSLDNALNRADDRVRVKETTKTNEGDLRLYVTLATIEAYGTYLSTICNNHYLFDKQVTAFVTAIPNINSDDAYLIKGMVKRRIC